ncbi:hypothetical protein DFH11DRAFT_1726283 [Phellopilus nigrolimitatus]|nr:hypothetical protein DFH11DRAFT_1726283 [Phellopilus nigrolimitatus]
MLMDAVLEPISGERPAEVETDDTNLRGLYSLSNAENGERNGKWLGLELTASEEQESMVSMLFNAIAERVRDKFKISKESVRSFSNQLAKKPASDTDGQLPRHPDVVVLDAANDEEDDWEDIRGCFAVNINNKTRKEARSQTLQYATTIFSNQPERRFVLTAALLNNQMTFILYNRAGEFVSKGFDVHEEPEKLVRIVVGFAFCAEKDLGYDPSYYTRDGGMFIKLDEQEYQVVRDIFIDHHIFGRGTLVKELAPVHDRLAPVVAGHELVNKPGNCILKDFWLVRSEKDKEWDFLERMEKKNIDGVVRMAFHEEVMIDGKLDTLGMDGAMLLDLVDQDYVDQHASEETREDEEYKWEHFKDLEEREHHRMLLKTAGKPLSSFRSKKELVSAFRNVFKTIGELDDNGILHCDISPANIVLVEPDTGEGDLGFPDDNHPTSSGKTEPGPRLRRAVLIDFEFAVEKGSGRDQSRAHQMGSLPFMAIEVLMQNLPGSKEPPLKGLDRTPIMHDYYHDLESVFYSLCWLCIAQAGPHSKDRESTEPFVYKTSAIGRWAAAGQDEPYYLGVAYRKRCMVTMTHIFEREVRRDFHKYFEVLKPYVSRLREVICPPDTLSSVQKENVALGKSPSWINEFCKQRLKADVFHWIDKILVEAMADPDLDKDEKESENDGEDKDEDEKTTVSSSPKPVENCAIGPGSVQRLTRNEEPAEVFVEGENNEDPVVGGTDENNLFDNEDDRAHYPTDKIKSVRSHAPMSGSLVGSAPVDSGFPSVAKRSFVDADIQDEDEAALATTSQKRPREV